MSRMIRNQGYLNPFEQAQMQDSDPPLLPMFSSLLFPSRLACKAQRETRLTQSHGTKALRLICNEKK